MLFFAFPTTESFLVGLMLVVLCIIGIFLVALLGWLMAMDFVNAWKSPKLDPANPFALEIKQAKKQACWVAVLSGGYTAALLLILSLKPSWEAQIATLLIPGLVSWVSSCAMLSHAEGREKSFLGFNH